MDEAKVGEAEQGYNCSRSRQLELKASSFMLVNPIEQLVLKINQIKNSDTYKTVSQIKNWDEYFIAIKTELTTELQTLEAKNHE